MKIVDGHAYNVRGLKVLRLIERLVRERDAARAELRGERERTLRWRCDPPRDEGEGEHAS